MIGITQCPVRNSVQFPNTVLKNSVEKKDKLNKFLKPGLLFWAKNKIDNYKGHAYLYYFWVMKMMFGLMQVITAIKAEVCRKATIPASTFHRFTTITLMGHETFHFNRELQQCGSQGFPVFVEPFLAHFVGAGGGSGHHIIVGIWRVTITQSARIFLFFTLFHIFHTTMLLFFQRQSRRKLDGGFPGFI